MCGTSVSWLVPADDNRERHVCDNASCATIHYQNPRIITGVLPIHNDKVLLCKRAIEPRYGLWTLPAGFLENGESTEQGALRESWEEAKATLKNAFLYTIFDLPHINQVYFFYKAELADTNFDAGEESLDVKLFTESEIPWQQLAFPVVEETLKYYFSDRGQEEFIFRAKVLKQSHTDKK